MPHFATNLKICQQFHVEHKIDFVTCGRNLLMVSWLLIGIQLINVPSHDYPSSGVEKIKMSLLSVELQRECFQRSHSYTNVAIAQ